MNAPSSQPTTVHGRMIEHMQLARRMAERTGRIATEAQVLRLMEKYSLDALRQVLDGGR